MLRFVLSLIFRGQAREANASSGMPWCTIYDWPQ
jgi:hypothetical protein